MAEPHPIGPLCIVCHRREDDPLHGKADLGGISNPYARPRYPQHDYDPGERRHGTRRGQDRQNEAWDKARHQHDIDEWNRKRG